MKAKNAIGKIYVANTYLGCSETFHRGLSNSNLSA